MGNHNKEYVPVFAVNQHFIPEQLSLPPKGNYNNHIFTSLGGATPSTTIVPYKRLAMKLAFDQNRDSHDGAGIMDLEELEAFCDVLPNAIAEYATRKEDFTFATNPRGDSYDSLFLALSENNWGEIRMKSSNYYLTNLGACFQIGKSITGKIISIKPIFVLVTKPEFIKYLRLCWLTGKDPDPSIFEMWADPEFSSKGTNYKYMRVNFRTKVKPWLEENNIKIVPVSDIFERLFYSIKMPSDIKTIKERKGWIEENTREVLEHLKIQKSLDSKGIKLKP